MSKTRSLMTVHLSTARSWRGGENQLLLLCKGLQAQGHRALIVAPKAAPLLTRAESAGIPHKALTVHTELDLLAVWRLHRLFKKIKPDVVHLHDAHAVLPGKWAASPLRAKGTAVVAHRRTVFPIRSAKKYDSAIDRIVCISQAVKEVVVASGLPPQKTEVVYSGMPVGVALSTEHLAGRTLRQKLGIANEAFVIGHAAALSAEKRQCDLLEIYSRFARSIERPSALLIAGSGPLEAQLRTQAKDPGIDRAQVHFLGFQQDLRPMLAASDAVVYCSEAEGLCTALVEAQLAGKPAIATKAGGMQEVVADEETGYLIEIGDTETPVTRLLQLATDHALLQRLSRSARERGERLFGSDAMVEGMLSIYRKLISI